MSKPILLIHGAFHGAWCFKKVRKPLMQQGFDVREIDLPLDGTAGDIAAAREFIASAPEAVVLGHSYGGLIISHACIGLPISHLVYLAAMMPDTTEDMTELMQQHPTPLLNDAFVQVDGRLGIDPEPGIKAFYHDCDEADASNAVSQLRTQLVDDYPLFDSPPAWKLIDSTYIVCDKDRAIAPTMQEHFARRATHRENWPVAHSPFFNAPERIVELLTRLAT